MARILIRVELLRSLGLRVYYGDATRHDLLRAAGAEKARLLVLALDTRRSARASWRPRRASTFRI